MNDLINRADAISVLEIFTQTDTLGHTPKQIVEALPSAERRGRWKGERLIYPSGIIMFIYRCSECWYEERHAYEDTKPSNYCPNCGARMEADE